MNFMKDALLESDELYVLKKCLHGLITEGLFCDINDLFEEGEVFNPDSEEGIHVYSETYNEDYHCDFYFEGFRAHLVTGQQCIVSHETLVAYLSQACEWYKNNNPELIGDISYFENKYLII